MATICKTTEIDADADAVWDVVADFGAVHRRFAPGFVTDVTLEPGARVVTFAGGQVLRELFLSSDPATMRLAYSVQSDLMSHHSASFQVFDLGGGRSRLTWTADLLPEAAAPMVDGMMTEGMRIAAETLSRTPA